LRLNNNVVHRRYNHFIWLREKLVKVYANHAVPILPGKSVGVNI